MFKSWKAVVKSLHGMQILYHAVITEILQAHAGISLPILLNN